MGKLWVPEEDAVIVSMYSREIKHTLMTLLPNRSWIAIRHRAQRLGIQSGTQNSAEGMKQRYRQGDTKCGNATVWSNSEIAILGINFYSLPKPQLINLLPKRSWQAILNKAHRIGLKRHPSFRSSFFNTDKGKKIRREHLQKLNKRLNSDPIFKEKRRLRWKKLHSDPEFRKRVLLAQQIKPNKLEQKVIDVIEEYKLPYRYCGDGNVIIGGYSPDFINTDGRKVIIEVFGDYWHSNKKARSWKETELGRIMAYNGIGFHCLVLWEREINQLAVGEIAKKIKTFEKRKLKCK